MSSLSIQWYTLSHANHVYFPTRGYLFSSGGFRFSCALTPHSAISGGEWHEPRMLFWHPQPGLGPPTDQTGYKKGYVRVPKFKLAEIPFAKNIRILVTKIQIFKRFDLVKNIPELCTNLHMIFKSLKDHTRGMCRPYTTLIISLAQIYQCYIQIRISTC